MQHVPLIKAFNCPILLMMGRKSSADEGPVHSPIGRRHAMKQKRRPNKKHNRTNQTPNKQRTATKNQNKGDIAGDLGPYRTLQKKMALAISIPQLQCGNCNAAPPNIHQPLRTYPRYSATPCHVFGSISQCN
jgi:hypothetical protein